MMTDVWSVTTERTCLAHEYGEQQVPDLPLSIRLNPLFQVYDEEKRKLMQRRTAAGDRNR